MLEGTLNRGIEALSAFGIDIESLLRQLGNRVGEELSFSLRNIEGNIEYLNEIMDWCVFAGLDNLSRYRSRIPYPSRAS